MSWGDSMAARVLLVDDEPTLLRAIKRLLIYRFDVTTASSGEEALSILRSAEPFDCVISDMKMPQMDGLELVQQIVEQWPATVCIILTGNQDEDTLNRISNSNAVFRLLNKPTPGDELIAAIESAVLETDANRIKP